MAKRQQALSIMLALQASAYHSFIYRSLFLACQMQAVGITSSLAIPRHLFSASSSRVGFEPDKARLHRDGAWSPSNDGNPNDFLQVDLQYDFFICGVATQGHPRTSSSFWTTKYKLLFSVDGTDWLTYKENGTDKVGISTCLSEVRYSTDHSRGILIFANVSGSCWMSRACSISNKTVGHITVGHMHNTWRS